MHGLVLDDDEADGHVAHHPRQEDQEVDDGQGDEQGEPDVFRSEDLEKKRFVVGFIGGNESPALLFWMHLSIRGLRACSIIV